MKNKVKLLFSAAIQLAIFVTAAQIADAQVYGGRAIGISGSTTVNGVTTNYSVTDTGQLPSNGGNVTATSPSFSVPGLMASGVQTASSSGALKSSQSTTVVNDFVFALNGVSVRANRVTANSGCICCPEADLGGCTANTRVNSLIVTDASGVETVIRVTGDVNQVVELPGGIGTLTINEQTGGAGGIIVNGLHIRASSNGNTYDIVVANAQSTLQCLTTSPTAGPVTISGKVVTSTGRGISGATVSLSDETGNTRTTRTNSTGYFTFTEVPSGQNYILNITHRSYTFSPMSIGATDDLSLTIAAN